MGSLPKIGSRNKNSINRAQRLLSAASSKPFSRIYYEMTLKKGSVFSYYPSCMLKVPYNIYNTEYFRSLNKIFRKNK